MKTPEILKEYELYGHTENYHTLTLFAVSGSNWDYYADETGTLYSIAKPGSGCQGTFFGDCNHIRHLINEGYWDGIFTEYGKKLMAA